MLNYLQSSNLQISRDPNVYIYRGAMLQKLSRLIIALLVVTLLCIPIIIVNALSHLGSRIIVIVLASTTFIAALSTCTRARTTEIFIAGAT